MVSLSRRRVLIGGAVSVVVPSIGLASAEKLILSGRVATDGKPVPGATFMVVGTPVTTDADGRFVAITDTVAYPARNARRDAEGTWRATVSLTL